MLIYCIQQAFSRIFDPRSNYGMAATSNTWFIMPMNQLRLNSKPFRVIWQSAFKGAHFACLRDRLVCAINTRKIVYVNARGKKWRKKDVFGSWKECSIMNFFLEWNGFCVIDSLISILTIYFRSFLGKKTSFSEDDKDDSIHNENFWYDHFSHRYGPSKKPEKIWIYSCSLNFCEGCNWNPKTNW